MVLHHRGTGNSYRQQGQKQDALPMLEFNVEWHHDPPSRHQTFTWPLLLSILALQVPIFARFFLWLGSSLRHTGSVKNGTAIGKVTVSVESRQCEQLPMCFIGLSLVN